MILSSTSSYVHFQVASFCVPSYTDIRGGAVISGATHSCTSREWEMNLKTDAFCYPEPTSNSRGFSVPLSLAHRYSAHFSLYHILHDNLWSVQHYFFFFKPEEKHILFSSSLLSYQSTEAFDSKAKQKANTGGQIMPSVERSCVSVD